MKIEHAKLTKINHKIMKEWIDRKLNILLIGEKGVGKTQISREVAVEKFGAENVVYVSAPTLDPFLDLIGVPKEENVNGVASLQYIRPKRMHNDIKALIIDELNRASHRKILDALMELIQFRSINGVKFEKLETIIACINPPSATDADDEFSYNVCQLDPAQIDRFHIIVQIPHKPDRTYFVSKFGNDGQTAVDWWSRLGPEAKKTISPRRLEMCLDMFRNGVNIEYALPYTVNIADLVKSLTSDDLEKSHRALMNKPTLAAVKKAVKNLPYWNKYSEIVMGNSNMWRFFEAFPEEQIGKLLDTNEDFRNWFVQQSDPLVEQILEKHQEVHKSKYLDLYNHLKKMAEAAKVIKPKRVKLFAKGKDDDSYFNRPFNVQHTYAAWPDMSSFDAMNDLTKNPGRVNEQDCPYTLPERLAVFQNAMEFIDADGVAALNDVGVFVNEDGKERQINNNDKDWLAAFIIRELEEDQMVKNDDELMEDPKRFMPELFKLIPALIEHRSASERAIYMKKIKDYYAPKFKNSQIYSEVLKEIVQNTSTTKSTKDEIEKFLRQ